jgi:hypothetical protein
MNKNIENGVFSFIIWSPVTGSEVRKLDQSHSHFELFQMVISFFANLMGPVSIMFCGHLGTKQLDGVALANTVSLGPERGRRVNESRTDFHKY